MRNYCRVRFPKEVPPKSVVFCSGQDASRLVAVSSRPLPSNIAEKYITDSDLRDGLSQLKSCDFYEFERVFTGLQRYPSVHPREDDIYTHVFKESLQELYDGQSCAVIETTANCRK
jgi:hypothetical protein